MAGEALALRRKLGKPLGISHALGGLFFALMCLDEPQKAREAVEEALQIDRLEQSREGVAWDLLSLTFIALLDRNNMKRRSAYWRNLYHLPET
jgi:hypothetical protein